MYVGCFRNGVFVFLVFFFIVFLCLPARSVSRALKVIYVYRFFHNWPGLWQKEEAPPPPPLQLAGFLPLFGVSLLICENVMSECTFEDVFVTVLHGLQARPLLCVVWGVFAHLREKRDEGVYF